MIISILPNSLPFTASSSNVIELEVNKYTWNQTYGLDIGPEPRIPATPHDPCTEREKIWCKYSYNFMDEALSCFDEPNILSGITGALGLLPDDGPGITRVSRGTCFAGLDSAKGLVVATTGLIFLIIESM
jgi:hypothetical protein